MVKESVFKCLGLPLRKNEESPPDIDYLKTKELQANLKDPLVFNKMSFKN